MPLGFLFYLRCTASTCTGFHILPHYCLHTCRLHAVCSPARCSPARFIPITYVSFDSWEDSFYICYLSSFVHHTPVSRNTAFFTTTVTHTHSACTPLPGPLYATTTCFMSTLIRSVLLRLHSTTILFTHTLYYIGPTYLHVPISLPLLFSVTPTRSVLIPTCRSFYPTTTTFYHHHHLHSYTYQFYTHCARAAPFSVFSSGLFCSLHTPRFITCCCLLCLPLPVYTCCCYHHYMFYNSVSSMIPSLVGCSRCVLYHLSLPTHRSWTTVY